MKKIFPVIYVLFGVWMLWICFGKYQEQGALQRNGVIAQGALEQVTKRKVNFIFTGTQFEVSYQNQRQTFDVPSDLVDRYVTDGKFLKGSPIEVVYLPGNPKVAELKTVLGHTTFWGGLFWKALAGVVIALAGIFSLYRNTQAP